LNGRLISIQCNTEPFEVENDTIQARHPKMFKNGTYEFYPRNELAMSMPFDLIDRLNKKDWTAIDIIWLQKLLKLLRHAQSTTVKQIFLQPIN
jgi:hypothetical protein